MSDLVGFRRIRRESWTGDERMWAAVGQERNPHLPLRPARAPASRHRAQSVTQRTLARPINTVIEPWVDVGGDVLDINAGRAIRVGQRFLVNGRRYHQEANGTLYPVDGVGFHVLDRGAFRALGVDNEFGLSERAETILDRRQTALEARHRGRAVYEHLQRRMG